jgi:hypothetical protein
MRVLKELPIEVFNAMRLLFGLSSGKAAEHTWTCRAQNVEELRGGHEV